MKEIVLQIQSGYDNGIMSITLVGSKENCSEPVMADIFDISDAKNGDVIRVGDKLFKANKLFKEEELIGDELIRLDTTIKGIDSLIAKAKTVEGANELFKAKDVIYSQQRYCTGIQGLNLLLQKDDKGKAIISDYNAGVLTAKEW